jgi:urea transport system substrate-binding protein
LPGALGTYRVFQTRFELEKVMKSRFELMLAGLLATVGCKGPGEAAPATASSAATPAAASVAAAPAAAAPKASDTGPIKVGILHSLSGTMAISETSLKDVALMTIDQINAAGGVKGRKLEPVVVDPASNWPLFAEKARELLQKEGVAVTFGCWTSVSRKSVLPVFEELNGLLFYPVQYEGEESSYNVFYTGAAPNQQAIPAVEYLMSKDGGGAKKWVLLGTDYVYPRTTNKILRYFLKQKGVAESDIMEQYTPFGHSDYQTIVADVKKFAAGTRTAVVSTINGDSNVPFYKELANQGLKAKDIPVVAFSVGEEELRGIDAKPLAGHLAAWNYFMSIENPENKQFIADWKAYVKAKNLPDGDKRVTNDPMEATYVGIKMWAQAVEQAGTTDVNAVRQAVGGQTVKAPSGFTLTMDAKNHHLHKPVYIAEIKGDGQFQVVWKTEGPIRAMPWSPFVPESAKKVADWTFPWVCGNCTEGKFKGAVSTAAL